MSIVISPITDPVAFSIFNTDIRWYGIIMSFSMMISVMLIFNFIKTNFSKKLADDFIDFSPLLIISGVVGARLFYICGNLKFYISNPFETVMINHGGLSIFGAILVTILFFYFYSRIKNIKYFFYMDMIALFLPLAQAIGRFGNYFNQEAFGLPANGILKLFVDSKYRPSLYADISYYHPTFLYEAMCDFFIFLFLFLFVRKSLKLNKYIEGQITFSYLLLYCVVRFLIEFIRIDSVMNVGFLSIAQIISLLLGVSAFGYLVILFKKNRGF